MNSFNTSESKTIISSASTPSTLYDKIWNNHLIKVFEDGTSLIYIDRHLIHEVTSPQAFEGLQLANRNIYNLDSILATVDHNVSTSLYDRKNIKDKASKEQIEALNKNANKYNLKYFDIDDIRQGIVHVIGPEQGFTQPGTTVVCGDSHTSTHGAFGALAFGIGTTEVEHVLATQTLVMKKSKNIKIIVDGILPKGSSAKDIILYIISKIGIAGGTGGVFEYTGKAISDLSIEGRMTICNMSIEGGARAGLVAPDDKTIAYLEGLPMSPKNEKWIEATKFWSTLCSEKDARFDLTHFFLADNINPQVTWGTNPEMGTDIQGKIPSLDSLVDKDGKPNINKIKSTKRALEYMDLKENDKLEGIKIDKIFIGSCTNARIEDLRSAAEIVRKYKLASNIKQAMVVPGSGLVKQQAEKEGLDKIFIESGFEWRAPGCSMCLGMNDDKLSENERCASTSNRNFEGRQGYGSRTHLVSPIMAAAAAIKGHLTDVRELI